MRIEPLRKLVDGEEIDYQFLMSALQAYLSDIESYLFQDLRIDEHALRKFNLRKLSEIAKVYQNEKLYLLSQFLKKLKKKSF